MKKSTGGFGDEKLLAKCLEMSKKFDIPPEELEKRRDRLRKDTLQLIDGWLDLVDKYSIK